MDPDETLARLLQLAAVEKLSPEQAVDFAELFHALDDWITRGGFLPRSWSAKVVFAAALNRHLEAKLEETRQRVTRSTTEGGT